MTQATLEGAFGDASRDAARAFRVCLNVMARPGSVERLLGAAPPAPLSVAAGSLLLTLCDTETPVHLAGDHNVQVVREWITFHTNAPIAERRADTAFALGRWHALLPLHDYPLGSSEYPDRSATLIVEMDQITANGPVLRGPGIRDSARLSLPEVDAFRQNHALFPRGLDFYFTAGDLVAALPRSTTVEVA